MKGIGCRNVEKYVHNHNREVSKGIECQPDSQLRIEHVLGSNTQSIKGQTIFSLSSEEVLYYSSQYFLAHNLATLETTVIQREGCFHHQVLFCNRYRTETRNSLILTIEKHQQHLYIGQLEIKGSVTEISKQTQEKQYSWKCSKLSNKTAYKVEDVSYHASKHYLYLLTSLPSDNKIEKYLWVYDLRRECMIMSPLIKPALGKSIISKILVTDEPNEVLLMGSNYFRLWNISFNEKILKESNYRNTERALMNHQIVKILELHFGGSKHLAVLTESTLLLLNKNELVSVLTPPMKSLKQIKNKDNIEVELENSLNQIYRMKFLYEEEESPKPDLAETQLGLHEYDYFRCASDVWQGEQGESIVVATSTGNLLTYCLAGGQMKLVNHLVVRKNYAFDAIAVSRKGELILLSEQHCQNLYLVNKYNLNSQQKDEQLKQFWGEGQVGKENIISLSSPAVHQRVCTLTEGNNFKMWSFRGRQRRILFQTKFADKVTEVALHPCGLLVAVNCAKQIKLMSVLPTGIYQVMTAKTNYSSVGLQYSSCGNYLISNEQNLLIFYNPFTLKTLGYIEPPELKSKIVSFQVTPEGNHIVFVTSDHAVYVQPLELYNYSKYDTMVPAHSQQEAYTCFHYDSNLTHLLSNKQGQPEDLFIGCSKTKYMVLYKNFGKELIVEFPVDDCYIVSLCVADGWLFAATSLNSIRVYKWPIREMDCQLEVLSLEHKMVRMQQPRYQEYSFWSDNKPISKMHRLGFSNKLLIAREGGIMTVLTYSKFYPQKFEQIGQRKKLTQNLNYTFYITKNESEKRNRMIEKTEGDILKIENEIAKEKIILERKYNEESQQHSKNFQEKIALQLHEKEEYLAKMQENNQKMKEEIHLKKVLFEEKKHRTQMLYKNKENYEDGRNQQVRDNILSTKLEHKQKIQNKIRQHKQDIRNIKESFRQKVSHMKDQFEKMVANQYPSLLTLTDTNQPKKRKHSTKRCSLRLQKQKSADLALEHALNDQQIIELNQKVEGINKSNEQLENQLDELKRRVRGAEYQDECLQKDFQNYLEQYNSNRFTNLSLHSQVLKMRTQLLERKQVMEHKQQIINVAYQERQKLENYKELVKGSLTKIHDKKENINSTCIQKQNEVALIFAELTANLNEYDEMKKKDQKLSALLKVYQKDKQKEQQRIEKAINRLKELKRYLLLQGLTEDQEQKQLYVQQENLLTSINFYKKRMTMETLKQKKNKGLKKSSLNLVLKQNKNLLEEVNHLRQDTLGCEHEINNLGKKLGEANRMISIECKLKGQKTEVHEQRNQLEAIRALFNQGMTSCKEVEEEEDIPAFDLD